MENRKEKTLRVAVFCRADADNNAGADALEAQATHFRKMIDEHPEWSCSGEFSVRGSGGSVKDDPEFSRMLECCAAGIIDLILTKFVSRFGLDMSAVREVLSGLQSLGVDIDFENEDMWLRDMCEQFERVDEYVSSVAGMDEMIFDT